MRLAPAEVVRPAPESSQTKTSLLESGQINAGVAPPIKNSQISSGAALGENWMLGTNLVDGIKRH